MVTLEQLSAQEQFRELFQVSRDVEALTTEFKSVSRSLETSWREVQGFLVSADYFGRQTAAQVRAVRDGARRMREQWDEKTARIDTILARVESRLDAWDESHADVAGLDLGSDSVDVEATPLTTPRDLGITTRRIIPARLSGRVSNQAFSNNASVSASRRPRIDTPEGDVPTRPPPKRLSGGTGRPTDDMDHAIWAPTIDLEGTAIDQPAERAPRQRASMMSLKGPVTNPLPSVLRSGPVSYDPSKFKIFMENTMFLFERGVGWPIDYTIAATRANQDPVILDTSLAAVKRDFLGKLEIWSQSRAAFKRDPFRVLDNHASEGVCIQSIVFASGPRTPPIEDPSQPGMTRSCSSCKNNRPCLYLQQISDEDFAATGKRWKLCVRQLVVMPAAPATTATRTSDRRASASGQ